MKIHTQLFMENLEYDLSLPIAPARHAHTGRKPGGPRLNICVHVYALCACVTAWIFMKFFFKAITIQRAKIPWKSELSLRRYLQNYATELQLVGVGVDYVFPRKKGRKKNPHLASNRRNGSICLNFGDCLVGVWKVFGNCLEGVWRASGSCLEGVWRVSEGCLNCIWRVFMGV